MKTFKLFSLLELNCYTFRNSTVLLAVRLASRIYGFTVMVINQPVEIYAQEKEEIGDLAGDLPVPEKDRGGRRKKKKGKSTQIN